MRKTLAVLICLFPFMTHADDMPPSLFFSADEVHQIEDINMRARAGKADTADIGLDALLYYGPGDWTLWMQGARWTPDIDRADLHVLDVKPGSVTLRLNSDTAPETRDIVLKPHQIYQMATGAIIQSRY